MEGDYINLPPPTWKLDRQIAEPKTTPIEDAYNKLKWWLSRTLFPQPPFQYTTTSTPRSHLTTALPVPLEHLTRPSSFSPA